MWNMQGVSNSISNMAYEKQEEKGIQKKPMKLETPHKHVIYGDSNTLHIKMFEIYQFSNPTLITKPIVCLEPWLNLVLLIRYRCGVEEFKHLEYGIWETNGSIFKHDFHIPKDHVEEFKHLE